MRERTLADVIYAPEHDMGPLKIRQPLPSERLPYLDPFVLLHHAPPRTMNGVHGVSAHPHCGFSPVSFIFEGAIRHRDSDGHNRTIAAGGTQWMHAGRGIVHEETPLAGPLELIQLWVNSPARHKADAPSYYPLTREETPRTVSDDGLVAVNVIAGHTLGLDGPVPTLTPLVAATIEARQGGRMFIPLPASHNVFLYVLAGSVATGGGAAHAFHQAVFAEGEGVQIEALEHTRALLMAGEPIGEPVVSYGPFVVSSEAEVREAFRAYREGRMGVLEPAPSSTQEARETSSSSV
jgi:redox-sensitive bicupin YhaK (pirin superfamily)